ncbi:fimbria/pilus outer membrane usher protein [Proteus sp. WDL240414]|uniref:Fimbria/pilus outer membrane usher protein n=1 Tax=Proteus genomosp. 6 TaxID=1311820 RepID=A0ABV1L812_9GAMM|nr:fimbria/pilus outer membrane usher protein [Proteus genomosp. 6]MBG3151846.1 fimbrial biogenesis outer membrane usher protein [Proteus mirabilis]
MKIKYKKKEVIFFIFMIICTKDAIAQNNFLSLYSNSFSNINDETIKLLLENKKPEGFYHSIIHINNRKKMVKLLYYKDVENKLTPSLSVKDLISLGIDTDFYTINKENPDPIILSDYSIDFKYQFSNQKLNLNIPQKALIKKTDYVINEQDWDDGITALFTQYSYWIKYHQKKSPEQKLNLHSGINIGAWRVRSQSGFNWRKDSHQSKLSSIYAYRQINSFSSLFYGGKFSPTTRILSNDKIVGFQLISNNLIANNTLYANRPVIEGIADTHANVIIKQDDKIIYETTVPPGPFLLNSLPSIGSEKLTLEIKETDGRVKVSTHYFTSLPNQLNKGNYQYNIISGTLTNYPNNKKPLFFLGEFSYGLSQKITSYSAIKKRDNRHNYLLGLSLDLGILGGLATDINYEKNNNDKIKYQFRYQKNMPITQTYFTSRVSFYHYLDSFLLENRIKKEHSFSLSKNINKIGYISLHYNDKLYDNSSKTYEIGTSFSSSINKINYNLKYDFKKEKIFSDHYFSFNFQIPIGSNAHHHWMNNQTNYQVNNKRYSNNTNIGGTLLNNNLGYSVSYQHTHHPKRKFDQFSVHARYQNNYQSYLFSGNKSENNYNYNLSVNGALLLHSEGITLTPRLSKTFALVNTQGITGIKTSFSPNLETDIFGNLILNNITPYRINNIKLNATTLPQSAETEYYNKNIIPTLGAIPKITFPIKIGYRILFKSITPLPFASKVTVLDKENNIISQGLVTENNIIFLSAIPDNGLIRVKWGEDKQCQFNYNLSSDEKKKNLIKKEINCL